MQNQKIELGDTIKDKITGMTGTVVAITNWLYSCKRVTAQMTKSKDGKYPDQFTIDEPQCQLVKRAAKKVAEAENGGPSIAPIQRANPTR